MKIKITLCIMVLLFLAACNEETASSEVGEGELAEEELYVVFRHLDLQTDDTAFVLTGDVQAEGDKFYYIINQGEETLLEEQEMELSSGGDWEQFEIKEELPEEAKDREEPPIITLYGKTDDGEVINSNYIPIDIGIK